MKIAQSAIDDRFWERQRYRGAPVKQHVLADLPDSPLIGDRVWQSFKQQCAVEGDILSLLISHLEPQDPDPGMFRRRGPRKPKGSDPFGDLPEIQRLGAEDRFRRLCTKWAGNLPSWRRAILAGVARRLTLHPPSSDWGKRMRRIKGGVHCQRKYRKEGWHPLARFNQSMAKRRNEAAETCHPMTRAEEARHRLGIKPKQMRGVPRMAAILACIEGGIEKAIEALRWSGEEDAIAFLRKYDSIPPADLKHLSVEEICVAAGVDLRRLLWVAVEGMMTLSVLKTRIRLALSLPDIADAAIKNATTPKGFRDRQMILESVGGIASAQPRTGPERKTQARPPTLAEVLSSPRALPGKLG